MTPARPGASYLIARLFGLMVALGCSSTPVRAASYAPKLLRATVVYVDDGDTVVILDTEHVHHRVRLASIDAPEVAHTSHETGRIGQPFASRSKEFLARLVRGAMVVATCPDVDRDGRLVCDLAIEGASANRAMVRAGLAWANTADRGRYLRDLSMLQLQSEARAARAGLWNDPNPVAPWEWRRRCWKEGQCDPSSMSRK